MILVLQILPEADLHSLILNPKGRHYHRLRETLAIEYEDNYWAEDALVLERNSRDFVSRIARINVNAEAICELLLASPKGSLPCIYLLTHLTAFS